jgi:hypothetical protein
LAYQFEFDCEHGTVLRGAVFDDGVCVQRTETAKVDYGATIDPERFVFVSPDGKPAVRIDSAATDEAQDGNGRAPVRDTARESTEIFG